MPVSSSVVTSYYQAIMRATPTSAQVAALSTLADTTALTNTLLGSANNSVDPLIRVYQAAFGRVPDSSGLDYWVGVYNAGGNSVASLQAITAGFAGSTEFRNAYDGLDNRGYVSALYANVLGRAGDAGGIDYWVGVLGSGVARSTVLREFASSAEFKATTDSLIDSFLSSAAAGTQTYSGSLLSGAGSVREYNLTTNVDSVSGSAANDLISGVIGTSGTYTVGDSINGYGGNDTLNLIDTSGEAAGLVSLRGIETVNVRTVTADVTQLDAVDWTGVATLTNASSLAGSTLQVSGLAVSTEIKLFGDTNVSADFVGLTSGTETATLSVVGAGSGSAATALAYASAELDMDGAGLLDAITLNVSGSSYVHVEGGSELRTLTVRGQASNLVLSTTATESITSLDASGFSGAARFFLSAREEVNVIGGAGNDTFEFGTSLGYGDVVNGGAGTDTINATIGNAAVRLSATSIEAAKITLGDAAAGDFDVSGAQAITSITVEANAAGNAGAITNFAGSTVNLADDNIGDFTIDTIANASLTVNVGFSSGSADVDLATVTIADATSVTVNTTGSGTQDITTLTVGATSKAVVFNTTGSAALAITDFNASGATSVTFNTFASASITITDADIGSAINVFTINAGGSNAGDFSMMGSGTGASAVLLFDASSALPDVVTFNANSGADITIGTEIQLGTAEASGGVQAPVFTLNAAGNGSIIANSASSRASSLGAGIDINFDNASATLILVAGASGTIQIGTADMGDVSGPGTGVSAGNVSLNITASVAQDGLISIASISADDADINLGAVTVGSSGGFVFGSAAAGITLTTATASFGTITLADAATATIGAIGDGNGSGGKVTGLSIVAGSAAGVTIGAVSASGVGGITLNLGVSATAGIGVMQVDTLGAITVTLAEQATATFAKFDITGAAASIGVITATVGSGAEFTMASAGSAGATNAIGGSVGGYVLTVANSASADIGAIVASGGRVGDITLNVSGGGDVDFGTIAASAVGSILVSGSGSVTFGAVSAASVAGIDLRRQGSGGDFTIDLAGVTNGVIVDGGAGSTTVTSSKGNDEFYLKTGLGTDTIRFTSATQATDSIYRFEGGTADDKISVIAGVNGVVGGSGGIRDGDGSAAATVDLLSTTAATALGEDTNIVVLNTAIADVAAMVAFVTGNVSFFTANLAGSGGLVVVWGDGNDSNVTVVHFDKAADADDATISTATITTHNLATLVGVSAGSLVAANFALA